MDPLARLDDRHNSIEGAANIVVPSQATYSVSQSEADMSGPPAVIASPVGLRHRDIICRTRMLTAPSTPRSPDATAPTDTEEGG
jgi:hypothetical protein